MKKTVLIHPSSFLLHPSLDEAAAALTAARAIVDEARRLYPDDLALLNAEVDLVQNEPAPVGAAQLVLGSGAKAAPALLPRGRADRLVHEYAFAKKQLPRMVSWLRWLQFTGRLDEAETVLKRMEDVDFPNDKKSLQGERVRLLMQRGQTDEVNKLVKEIQQRSDLPTVTQVYYDSLRGDFSQAQSRVEAALNRHESQGQMYYLRGQIAQHNGEYDQAVKAYERSMQYVQFKNGSQNGLVTSLVAWAEKAPAEATKEATRLVQTYPDEPTVLQGYAEIARVTDNVYGKNGMKEAIQELKGVLARRDGNSLSGSLFAARMWASANRPDLARQEIKAALEANPKNVSALVLAGQLAQADEDWDELQRLAGLMAEAIPNSLEGYLWKAIGLENQGKTEDAKKIYEQLMKEAPNLSTGYLRLAALKEEAKDYAGALELLDKWLKLAPRDTSAFRGQVRVQAKNGKAEDAVKRGETFLKEERERLEKSFADSDKIQPAKDDKEKEQRAKNREQNLRTQEMVALINLVGGLMDAKAFDKAEPYVVKLLAMADKPPEGMSKDQTQVVQLFLGSYYLERGQKTKDKAAIDTSIELYEAVWKAAPGHPVAGNNLAWLMCMERKDPKAALAIIEKVRLGRLSGKPVSGDRLNAEILDTAGVVYNAAGKYDEELKLFEEAVKRYKNEPRVFVHLGRAYANQKKWGDAVENFNRGIEMADQKAQTVRDEERKARLKDLATKARAERDALGQTRR